MKSTYELIVRGYELDSFGHVNNAVYLQYAEACKWDFFEKTGISEITTERKFFPVILENYVKYYSALHLLDRVVIETEWKCGVGMIHFSHTFINKENGQRAAKVKGKLIFVDQNETMCDVPDQLRTFFEQGEKNELGEK